MADEIRDFICMKKTTNDGNEICSAPQAPHPMKEQTVSLTGQKISITVRFFPRVCINDIRNLTMLNKGHDRIPNEAFFVTEQRAMRLSKD